MKNFQELFSSHSKAIKPTEHQRKYTKKQDQMCLDAFKTLLSFFFFFFFLCLCVLRETNYCLDYAYY